MTTKQTTALFIILIGALIIMWLLYPAVAGFHTGYNFWTDHQCMTRIIQWCR